MRIIRILLEPTPFVLYNNSFITGESALRKHSYIVGSERFEREDKCLQKASADISMQCLHEIMKPCTWNA